MTAKQPGVVGRVPAPVLFLLGGGSMYLGAALAVGLFAVLTPAAVAWLRLLGAAVVLLALLPVTATVVGLLALAQVPAPVEAAGIVAVVAAVALRSRAGDEPAAPG